MLFNPPKLRYDVSGALRRRERENPEVKDMKTLIELFDERPIENVLSTEMFHPETTVFLCPGETAQNKELKSALKNYFKRIKKFLGIFM